MKKFLTLLLAAAMTLSLAACGSKTDDNSGNNSQPASALELDVYKRQPAHSAAHVQPSG